MHVISLCRALEWYITLAEESDIQGVPFIARGGWLRFSQNVRLRLTWIAWAYIAAYGKRSLIRINLLWFIAYTKVDY